MERVTVCHRSAAKTHHRSRSSASTLSLGEKLLQRFQPSRELISYYRSKILAFDKEQQELLDRLEEYKKVANHSIDLQHQLRRCNEQIVELQQSMSDLQVHLYQEREQVLRLHAENDRLKIRELEDRKKVDFLLSVCGKTENEMTFFLRDFSHSTIVPQKLPKRLERHKHTDGKEAGRPREEGRKSALDTDSLLLQINALQAQLEEQAKLSQDQITMLMEEKQLGTEERKADCNRFKAQLDVLTHNLHETQELLHHATKDFLHLRSQYQREERSWMAEKDSLFQKMAALQCHCQKSEKLAAIHSTSGTDNDLTKDSHLLMEINEKLQSQLEDLKEETKEKEHLMEMYQDQCLKMEEEMAQLRESAVLSRKQFKEQVKKLSQHVTRLKTHYDNLDKRRRLEAQGYLTDIRFLRNRIQGLEKQMYRIVAAAGLPRDEQGNPADIAMLLTLRQAASTARHAQAQISQAKAKIYEVENELMHM